MRKQRDNPLSYPGKRPRKSGCTQTDGNTGSTRRTFVRLLALAGGAAATPGFAAGASGGIVNAAAHTFATTETRFRAFRLVTGPDNASHVERGTIAPGRHTQVIETQFKVTPAHSAMDWHNDPEPQYVITLSGTLEFTTRDGETFILRPGDILVAKDHIGSGHKWRLIDDQPWMRVYVVLKPGTADAFVAAAAS